MTEIDKQRITKIFNHYEDLLSSLNNQKLIDIKNNKEKYKAIQFDIAQIGEYICHLPNRIQQYLGKKEARHIIYIRNAIIHTYDTYNIKDLEDSIYKYIPAIIKQLKRLQTKNYYLK